MNSSSIRLLYYCAAISLPVISIARFSEGEIGTLPLKYFISLFIPYVVIFILLTIRRDRKFSILQKFIQFSFLSLIFIFAWLEFLSYYFQGQSFNDAFYFHATPATIKFAYEVFPILYIFPLSILLLTLGLDIFLNRGALDEEQRNYETNFPYRVLLVILSLVFLANPVKTFFDRYLSYHSSATNFQLAPITSQLVSLNFNISALPNKQKKNKIFAKPFFQPKNLVLVYLEGIEATYLDEKRFPGLLPNISKLSAEGISFTNIRQLPNTSWSIAGVFASQCGITIGSSIDSIRNDLIHHNFSQQDFTCLSDVLKKAGYYQIYMKGASLDFAGNKIFAESHQYDETLGLNELKNEVYPKNYLNNWGIYDDTLFDLAVKQYDKLEKTGKPFNLTVLTVDTHIPRGTPSKSCPKYQNNKNQMLQAVHCTDYLLGKFITSLSERESFNNTVIFVMSDHLAMRNIASNLYPPYNQRKLLAFANNIGKTAEVSYKGAHFDVPHTIIDLLQIQTDAKFPLGQSLLKVENKERFKIFDADKSELIQNAYQILARYNHKIEICNDGGITLEYKDGFKINLGQNPMSITYAGVSNIPKDLVFLLQATKSGEYVNSAVLDELDVMYTINNNLDSIFLLIRLNKEIDNSAPPDVTSNHKWEWYFGNPQTGINKRGRTNYFSEIKIPSAVCLDMIKKISQISK